MDHCLKAIICFRLDFIRIRLSDMHLPFSSFVQVVPDERSKCHEVSPLYALGVPAPERVAKRRPCLRDHLFGTILTVITVSVAPHF